MTIKAQLEKGREPQTGQSACWHRQCSVLLAIRSKKLDSTI